MSALHLNHISKTFEFNARHGLAGFFRPDTKTIQAVHDLSLTVPSGQALAFIGPNGAGKSTTIKMLTGILRPTAGSLRVLGLDPATQRRALALRIGTVFGQRSQLVFNLPLTQSFDLTAAMYQVPAATARVRIAELVRQFDLADFIAQPVRKLSLGQRMRAEVANALIHQPDIIFLDEPTIGLDIVAKRSLRQVLKAVNRTHGTTIFLTSHDVGDIEEVCDRTVVINHGRVALDATTADLKARYLQTKTVSVAIEQPSPRPQAIAGVTPLLQDGRLVFTVDTTRTSLKTFMRALATSLDIADITIADIPLEDIIHELYQARDLPAAASHRSVTATPASKASSHAA